MSFKVTALAMLGAASLMVSAPALASSPPARAAATCSVGSGEGYGYTYLTSLTVKGTSCATGKSLVRHKGKVHGWSCTKKVLAHSSVQYDARMTCKSGSRRVVYGYSENT